MPTGLSDRNREARADGLGQEVLYGCLYLRDVFGGMGYRAQGDTVDVANKKPPAASIE